MAQSVGSLYHAFFQSFCGIDSQVRFDELAWTSSAANAPRRALGSKKTFFGHALRLAQLASVDPVLPYQEHGIDAFSIP